MRATKLFQNVCYKKEKIRRKKKKKKNSENTFPLPLITYHFITYH